MDEVQQITVHFGYRPAAGVLHAMPRYYDPPPGITWETPVFLPCCGCAVVPTDRYRCAVAADDVTCEGYFGDLR